MPAAKEGGATHRKARHIAHSDGLKADTQLGTSEIHNTLSALFHVRVIVGEGAAGWVQHAPTASHQQQRFAGGVKKRAKEATAGRTEGREYKGNTGEGGKGNERSVREGRRKEALQPYRFVQVRPSGAVFMIQPSVRMATALSSGTTLAAQDTPAEGANTAKWNGDRGGGGGGGGGGGEPSMTRIVCKVGHGYAHL